MRCGLVSLILASFLLAMPAAAQPDEIADQVTAGLTAYKRKDIAAAIDALETAVNLLRQERLNGWKALMPAPPAGWTADPAVIGSDGTPLLGGGMKLSRHYAKGSDTVDISVLADSPLVQTMGAVFNNPLFAAITGQVVVIDGRRFTYLESENALVTIAADKALVRVQGSRGLAQPALRPFASALDFPAIEKAVR